MYIQKKNGVWWLRENISNDIDGRKTLNQNLGKNYKIARKIVIEELGKIKYCDESIAKYKQKILDRMEKIEKANPSYVTLKMTYRQYEKIKPHLPPELRIY